MFSFPLGTPFIKSWNKLAQVVPLYKTDKPLLCYAATISHY